MMESQLIPRSKHKMVGPDGQVVRLAEKNGTYYLPALTFGRLLTAYNPSAYIHRIYGDLKYRGLVDDSRNLINANGNLFAVCIEDATTIAKHSNKAGAHVVLAWLRKVAGEHVATTKRTDDKRR